MSQQRQPVTESMKTISVQASHMPTQNASDPNLQAIMDSLQLGDSNVYRILRGEIEELMDLLSQELVLFRQQSEVYNNHYMTMNQTQQEAQLAKILAHQNSMLKIVSSIKTELQHYYKMVPYLLMLSPLMWLSNLTKQQVRDIQFRQSLMVQRDRCLREEDCDNSFDDDNFLDAVEVLMHVMVAGAREGWKSNIIRNEVREVKTTIEDRTAPEKKARSGLFSRLGI